MNTLKITALTLLLSACGGGSGPEPRSPILVAAYGDSTMRGTIYPGAHQSKTNAPATAQRVLAEKCDTKFTVANKGVGSTSAFDILRGTYGDLPKWGQELADTKPDTVVVNFALNDQIHSTPSEYAANMAQLVAIAQTAGAKVIVETANPIVPTGAPTVDNEEVNKTFRGIAIGVAEAAGAYVCDQHTAAVTGGYATLEHIPDGVHPTDTFYAVKGRLLAYCIADLHGLAHGTPDNWTCKQ